jgi:xanthine dehydrogenase iron-sulfur cluster and FAD-binding subunit A
MWQEYICATSIDEVLPALAEHKENARVVAGATDLILEMERGVRKGINVLIDISRIQNLDRITFTEDEIIHLGPLVTHNQCVASKLIREYAFPLARACWEIGSPQIRNRGTIAGNLITASPANDTIASLMALDAKIVLKSSKGERIVALKDFYLGVRRTVMMPDEMLVDIYFPVLKQNQRGHYIKLALRKAQAISLVNTAVILTFDDQENIQKAVITLGAVAPTIIHAVEAENYLKGKRLDEGVIAQAASLAMNASRPISDVRSSDAYRREMTRVVTSRALTALARGEEDRGFPETPVQLWGRNYPGIPVLTEKTTHSTGAPIRTKINGKEYVFTSGQQKTLLRLLREEAGLIGTKEGCAEGECGACTVHLDGVTVMSCMVPAPRAHGAEIVTIEGLAQDGQLHPVQQAFIEDGAVQCGYCTPGFIMSAVKLLEEQPNPTREQIQQAITGNLCRCTGYYKIVEAIEHASRRV